MTYREYQFGALGQAPSSKYCENISDPAGWAKSALQDQQMMSPQSF